MTGLGELWQQTATEQFSAPAFEGKKTVDLAIIGGGFTGCSAALQAAGQGADVALLEAQTIGHGGSGRNVGLVNAGLWLPPDVVNKALGKGPGERLNRVLADAPALVFDLIGTHAIDCEAQCAGTLHLAHSAKGLMQLRDRLAQMQARGAPVTLLDKSETRARTGSGAFHGALHDTRAGTIQPLSYARGLARAAVNAGASLYEHSPALGIEQQQGQWIITTNSGTLFAKALLLATNAYHLPVARMAMPKPTKVNYFQLATTPLSDDRAGDILPGGEGCWDSAMVMTSLRRDANGRVILGSIGGCDGIKINTNWAARKLAQYYPQLQDASISHAWSGQISMTADHLPRILRLGPRGFAIFGFSGRGIGPGTVFGRSAAEALILNDESLLPLTPVDAYTEALTGLKAMYYETGARLVHLASARRPGRRLKARPGPSQ